MNFRIEVSNIRIDKELAWAYTDWSRPSDPINIIFLGIKLYEIENFLTGNGWKKPHWFASNQYLPIPDPYNHRKQDLQLVKQLNRDWTRYHIRLWDIGTDTGNRIMEESLWKMVKGAENQDRIEHYFNRKNKYYDHRYMVIAGVHMDRTRGTGHVSADFESVESVFAYECLQRWNVEDDWFDMENSFVGYGQPYNNGRATVITP